MPSNPSLDTAPGVRIYLLGCFRVVASGRVVGQAAWRLRKAKSLVKLLALAPDHRLHREHAQELLWPDLMPAAAANNLKQALFVARRSLASAWGGATAAGQTIRLQGGVLALFPDQALWIDVDAFEVAAAAAHREKHPRAYQAALDLYTGDLLPEDRYEDWAARRREALRSLDLALLVDLAALREAGHERGAAIAALQRVLEREPAHEPAHAGLMRLFARAGDRQRALRQYQHLRDALRRELDAEPDTASQRLYDDLLAGRPPPPTS